MIGTQCTLVESDGSDTPPAPQCLPGPIRGTVSISTMGKLVGGQRFPTNVGSLGKVMRLLALSFDSLPFLSETPKAFSLNAIVDVRRRRRRHEMCFFGISRKLLELATSNFNTT